MTLLIIIACMLVASFVIARCAGIDNLPSPSALNEINSGAGANHGEDSENS